MSWSDKLKEAGINIHIIATGGGAGLQQMLWEVPGSSAYLSGASFPYDQDEQAELLGFMPKQFCSEEAAIDLASAAYMKAFKFGGKKPVGVGVTASVASEKEHRGDHRVFVCVITNDKVMTNSRILKKGTGLSARLNDGRVVDNTAFYLLIDTLACSSPEHVEENYNDATDKARECFFKYPFFSANGKRQEKITEGSIYAMMPGSFNPPHEGHFGIAKTFRHQYAKNVLFEIGTNPPHKTPPTVQELLQRAKMLKGYDILFSKDMPMYLEKAKYYPGMDMIIGADTMQRILDPKWGINIKEMLHSFKNLNTKLYVSGRVIDNKWTTVHDIIKQNPDIDFNIFRELTGRWDISSTELRNK